MNSLNTITLKSSVQAAEVVAREKMTYSLQLAKAANVAAINLYSVEEKWGKDSDVAEIATEQVADLNQRLVVANRATAAALEALAGYKNALAASMKPEVLAMA